LDTVETGYKCCFYQGEPQYLIIPISTGSIASIFPSLYWSVYE